MSLDDDRLDIDDDAPDLLREALGFARLGWAVFPVVGKEPPVAGAGRLAWSRASSSDSEELVELFGRHPEATGIGLDAGKSGLVVIDADRLPALSEWLGDDVELLDAAHGPKLHGRRDRASWIFAQPAGEPIACPDHPGGEIKGAGGYVVLPPSLHPDISARYEWIVEPAGDVPALPVRIEARIRELGSSKSGGGYADVPPEWLTAGVSCRLVKRRLYEAINEMDQAAQPAMRDASLALLRLGHERHEGVSEALSELTESYVATVGRKRGTKAPRSRETAIEEMRRAARGAAAMILATPSSEDPFAGRHVEACAGERCGLVVAPEPASSTPSSSTSSSAGGEWEASAGEEWPSAEDEREARISQLLGKLDVEDEARRRFEARKLGLGTLPPIESLREAIDAPDSATVERIAGVLDVGGTMTIVAQHKTGKTTLVANLIRSLLSGEDFLGKLAIPTPARKILVLNYEVLRSMFTAWLVDVGLDAFAERVLVWHLRGRPNPLRSDAGKDQLRELLAELDPDVVILDTFGRAFTGRSQNDNGEVTAFLVELRELIGPARDLVVTVHAGWDAERARGATALVDDPDAIVTLVRDKKTGRRYFSVRGRGELELNGEPLDFDARTRRLSIEAFGTRRSEAAEVDEAEELADRRLKRDLKEAGDKAHAEAKLLARVDDVVELLRRRPGLPQYRIAAELEPSVSGAKAGAIIGRALARELIREEEGRNGGKAYFVAE